MSETWQSAAETSTQQREAFAERMLKSTAGVFDIFTIYLGDRLGFYRALAESEALTAAEVAARTGTHERYVREWLEQQTMAGIIRVADATVDAAQRRFSLPRGHAEVLVERDSLDYLAPLAQLVVGATRPLEALLEAYRRGGGVPYADYGTDVIEGQAGMNRAMFLRLLGNEWLPAIPDLHARLQSNPPARVADVGCGAGWSSIGMAQSYPHISVDGFDLDAPSIELARKNAVEAGLASRVRFHVRNAGDPELAGQYDLVTAFECLHDMAQPIDALRAMRRLVHARGVVLVVDERVGEAFTPTGNDVEWMMYGWSVLHCLPVGMADQPSAATGTVMRPATLQQYATAAGFRRVEVLPIEHLFFRFYRLEF
jgi:2-polyprenyl-3-methyl-5-hydroxy-6-metoxy-1,4-benzoquinol methylase